MDLLGCLQVHLRLLQVALRLRQIILNVLEHLTLGFYQHRDLLKELKEFVNGPFKLEDGLEFVLDFGDGLLELWMRRSHDLCHD